MIRRPRRPATAGRTLVRKGMAAVRVTLTSRTPARSLGRNAPRRHRRPTLRALQQPALGGLPHRPRGRAIQGPASLPRTELKRRHRPGNRRAGVPTCSGHIRRSIPAKSPTPIAMSFAVTSRGSDSAVPSSDLPIIPQAAESVVPKSKTSPGVICRTCFLDPAWPPM